MTQKNPEIEALRGIAVAMVLLQHSLAIAPWINGSWLNSLLVYFNFGSGVDLFFVISGYVVSKSLLGSTPDFHLSRQKLLAFFVKRIFRLLPVSFLVVFLTLLFTVTLNQYHQFGEFWGNIKEAISVLLYSYNFYLVHLISADPQHSIMFGPYWSLSLEEQFYFALPVLVLLAGRKHLMKVVGTLIILQFVIFMFFWNPALFYFRFGMMFLGVMLFLTETRWPQKYSNFAPSRIKHILAWIISIGLIALLARAGGQGDGHGGLSNNIPMFGEIALGEMLIGASALALVWLASYNKGHGLKSRILVWLGSRSYALYLLHMMAFRINLEIWNHIAAAKQVNLVEMHLLPIIATATQILFLITEAVVRYVEQPLTEKGREIAKRITAPTNSPSPA